MLTNWNGNHFCTAPATMINPYGGDNVVLLEDIENAPTVEAEPVKHGRWIYDRLDAEREPYEYPMEGPSTNV